MERELWTALYQLAKACDTAGPWLLVRFLDWEVVAVFLWAVLHDRPVCWACDPINWPKGLWKRNLPSQSTMSRRLRTTEVQHLLHLMEQRMIPLQRGGWVTMIDGKPLVVGTHSKDADAQWGRAGRGFAKGYKLHALYADGPLPLAWEVAPLNVAEPDVAARLISTLGRGGYVLGDKIFDSNPLHEVCWAVGAQLVAQRKRPGTGLGHRRHSPGRLRCIELLEHQFGQALYHCRDDIERQWGWLTNHGCGLAPLPNWVRRASRVRIWVQAKLIIHAMYAHTRQPNPELAVA
jgi:DDE family transposase